MLLSFLVLALSLTVQPFEDGSVGECSIRLTCACLWGVFLIANWQRRAHPNVGSAISRQAGPGCFRKLNHGPGSKPVSSLPQFLPSMNL